MSCALWCLQLAKFSYMLTNVNTILQKAEIKYSDLFHINKLSLKKALQKSAPQPDWRSNIVRELMDIRDGQLISNLEKEETNAMLRHISTYRWNSFSVSPPSKLLQTSSGIPHKVWSYFIIIPLVKFSMGVMSYDISYLYTIFIFYRITVIFNIL